MRYTHVLTVAVFALAAVNISVRVAIGQSAVDRPNAVELWGQAGIRY